MIDVVDLWTCLAALELVARAPGLAERDDYQRAAARVRAEIEAQSGGACVFRLVLPLEITIEEHAGRRFKKPITLRLAPRLNEYAALPPWTLKMTRAIIDAAIEDGKASWPRWDCGSEREVTKTKKKRGKRMTEVAKLSVSGGRRRILEVVRYSSRQVDELAIDVLGGKVVVDRLIWAGVIAGDAQKHIVRRPRWVPVKPGQGRLEIVAYEMPGRPYAP